MDGEGWWAIVHGTAKSHPQLGNMISHVISA